MDTDEIYADKVASRRGNSYEALADQAADEAWDELPDFIQDEMGDIERIDCLLRIAYVFQHGVDYSGNMQAQMADKYAQISDIFNDIIDYNTRRKTNE